MVEESCLSYGSQVAKRRHACACGLIYSFLFIPSGLPDYWMVPPTLRMGLITSSIISKTLSQTNPEMFLNNFLGISQANQVDNRY
jgi:hypothetical protein